MKTFETYVPEFLQFIYLVDDIYRDQRQSQLQTRFKQQGLDQDIHEVGLSMRELSGMLQDRDCDDSL